ncbi:SagB family peptide dehydrogenase [Streptomyces lydicus]|uniref:SagB family peptide dehydrogenase n=1 Tax=Streptomyces lydicus TaxID=47763 RepID=UPI000527E95F|nr:SagB family peptide dehydrogenase [Streptomyces lydicus]MDC7340877.1 SagB family peptide dehydrogenase [Streptomyces lydicus]UEG89427.1 SagB family peptide dehydrogenase [Streptomyces lydicus]
MPSVADGLQTSVGLRFWWRTFEGVQALFAEGHGEEGGADDPLPVKTYRGLPRHVLLEPAPRIGDARWSFEAFRAAHPPAAPSLDALDPRTLSALLYWTYGVGRIELGPQAVWPYHRMVASARCFHPVELYVWLAHRAGDLPAGCYHYHPAHHSLTRLREGGVPDAVRAAAGVRADIGLLVVSAWFRKTAFRYRDYAYRLCAQETGMTVGNALLTGAALGLRGRVHHRFDDTVVNRALGLDGREETAFAVIDLAPAGEAEPLPLHAAERQRPLSACALPAIDPRHVRTNRSPSRTWSGLTTLDLAARLTGPGAAIAPESFHLPAGAPGPDGALSLAVPESGPGGVELSAALRARDSGGRMFLPAVRPLAAGRLMSAVRYALEPVSSDHTEAPCRPLVDAYVLILGVDGISPGLYRLEAGAGSSALVRLPERDWRAVVDMLCDRTPAVNSAKADAIVFLTAHRLAGERWFGARGYRILHQEAGIVAQRVSVLAAAAGLSVRVTNGYHDAMVRDLIGVNAAHVPVFTLVMGRRRPTAQYEPQLIW